MRTLLDLLLVPELRWSYALSLVTVSVIFGVLLVPVYGKVSFQGLIKNVKRSIGARMLESVLFRNQLKVTLKAQAGLAWNGVLYFLYAVPPILLLAIPCVIALAYFNLYFGARGVKVNEPLVVQARVADPSLLDRLQLSVPQGVEVVGPVRVAEDNSVSWRVTVRDRAAAETSSRAVAISDGSAALASTELALDHVPGAVEGALVSSWWERLLYPSRVSPPAQINAITLNYPERSITLLGWRASWLVHFIVISILSGYVASKFFGVEV